MYITEKFRISKMKCNLLTFLLQFQNRIIRLNYFVKVASATLLRNQNSCNSTES